MNDRGESLLDLEGAKDVEYLERNQEGKMEGIKLGKDDGSEEGRAEEI